MPSCSESSWVFKEVTSPHRAYAFRSVGYVMIVVQVMKIAHAMMVVQVMKTAHVMKAVVQVIKTVQVIKGEKVMRPGSELEDTLRDDNSPVVHYL